MSDRVAEILLDSFSKILIPGLTATIPLALISFAIALVIAMAVALVQYAKKPADEGFRAKAEELIKELFGPTYGRVLTYSVPGLLVLS